jgi:hypothetical protein
MPSGLRVQISLGAPFFKKGIVMDKKIKKILKNPIIRVAIEKSRNLHDFKAQPIEELLKFLTKSQQSEMFTKAIDSLEDARQEIIDLGMTTFYRD